MSGLPYLWIVMPTHGGVHAATTGCLLALAAAWAGSGGGVRMLSHQGSLIALQRDRLTRAVLDAGAGDADIILWFDSDMSVDPPELARFLLRTPMNAVVGVPGRKKQDEVVWCCEVDEDQSAAEGLPESLSHLIAGRAGGACMAMRGATLRRIFEHSPSYTDGKRELREVWMCGPYTVNGQGGEQVRLFIGEDIGFGLRAQDAGVATLLDPTVTIWHHDGGQKFGGKFGDSAMFSVALNNNGGTG